VGGRAQSIFVLLIEWPPVASDAANAKNTIEAVLDDHD
jgi:hypothetical protein